MRQAVIDGFVGWTQTFESFTTYFYLDVAGLVTIGYGNLADPLSLVVDLEFVHLSDGGPVTRDAVAQAWKAVKMHPETDKAGGAHYAQYTNIRATPATIAKLCTQKLAQIDHDVRAFFPDWDSLPAKVQLGIASMCWAMGAGKLSVFTHFREQINAKNFAAVAVPHSDPNSCRMSEVGENESFHLRNEANCALFLAASQPSDDPESIT